MSSPMMNRILGLFCCCCCAADGLTADGLTARGINARSKIQPHENFLKLTFILFSSLLAEPIRCSKQTATDCKSCAMIEGVRSARSIASGITHDLLKKRLQQASVFEMRLGRISSEKLRVGEVLVVSSKCLSEPLRHNFVPTIPMSLRLFLGE